MSQSYYKTIDGKRYDREMLDLADLAVKGQGDGRISLEDAHRLMGAVKDGNTYTDVEKATMAYIRDNYRFTEPADRWFRTEIRRWAAIRSMPDRSTPPTTTADTAAPSDSGAPSAGAQPTAAPAPASAASPPVAAEPSPAPPTPAPPSQAPAAKPAAPSQPAQATPPASVRVARPTPAAAAPAVPTAPAQSSASSPTARYSTAPSASGAGRATTAPATQPDNAPRRPMLIGVGLAGAVLAGLLLWWLLPGAEQPAPVVERPAPVVERQIAVAPATEPVAAPEPVAVTPEPPAPAPEPAAPVVSAPVAPPGIAASEHVVTSGDTLWHLARQHFGDALLWPVLYGANASAVSDPDLLRPRQTIRLPALKGTPDSLHAEDRQRAAQGYALAGERYEVLGRQGAPAYLLEAARQERLTKDAP